MTERQERFIDEFLLTGSATESARRAGYSPKSARYQGCKLLRKLGKLIGAFDKKESTDASRLFISTLEKIYNASQV